MDVIREQAKEIMSRIENEGIYCWTFILKDEFGYHLIQRYDEAIGEEYAPDVVNKYKERLLTLKEVQDLAMAHYTHGGDGIYECTDERDMLATIEHNINMREAFDCEMPHWYTTTALLCDFEMRLDMLGEYAATVW